MLLTPGMFVATFILFLLWLVALLIKYLINLIHPYGAGDRGGWGAGGMKSGRGWFGKRSKGIGGAFGAVRVDRLIV
jgi:hypothetical protein